eukprot:CAMPEP_0114243232 /NCGR_PEP_ID=MMETSP0058-20121206/10671_1 /TAXON_ID=36894 /ORGANISM="Pyramimonas parkeae, CCMP726" /LENGTH=517 /DNA_ID=CAMNT_0001356041 /DNA_START=117 /DNA_END=1670 /DNA_ORIENTATION=+
MDNLNTSLRIAARDGRVDEVRKLAALGADVGMKDKNGQTALHSAATWGHTEMVKALVDLGADVRSKDKDGRTALSRAACWGQTETVKVLAELEAEVCVQDKDGNSALHEAAGNGHTETVKALVQLRANMQAQDSDGDTALHRAADKGHTETAKALVQLGAHLHAQNNDGRTPQDCAAVNRHSETAKALEELSVQTLGEAPAVSIGDSMPEDVAPVAEPMQGQTFQLSHLNTYSSAVIVDTTRNFSSESIIGEGGFGKVYRGKLRGMDVAIKKLDPESMQGRNELYSELSILGTIGHRHIVSLYGWCPEELCLVYELCERGSLEECLPQLRWYDRVRVAKEVCCALLCLHKREPDGIVHRDIKPSNVLLDKNWNAKLSDVGLGKIFCSKELRSIQSDPSCRTTLKIVGTFAYIDPEYLLTSKVSFSSDVYSLGMLLLHMVTGKPVHGDVNCRHVAEDALEGRNSPFVDEAAGPWPLDQALAFARLALRCIDHRRHNRPDLENQILPHLEMLYEECSIE